MNIDAAATDLAEDLALHLLDNDLAAAAPVYVELNGLIKRGATPTTAIQGALALAVLTTDPGDMPPRTIAACKRLIAAAGL